MVAAAANVSNVLLRSRQVGQAKALGRRRRNHQHVLRRCAPPSSSPTSSSSEDITPPSPTPPQPARDDDVLPDSLDDAVSISAARTTLALNQGVTRCIVELIIPELWDPISGAVMAESGDQMRLWDLSRSFIVELKQSMEDAGNPQPNVHVLYPDEGVAALLRNRWQDAEFTIGSMNERRPLARLEDRPDVVVVASPDPQSLDSLQNLELAASDMATSLVLLNPRLASGDAGIGLNVRRMRQNFLNRFSVTYSLRPIEDFGAQLKRYPEMWKIFLADPELPGRYCLAKELVNRPSGDEMEMIIDAYARSVRGDEEDDDQKGDASPLDSIMATMRSVQRFMNQITK